MNYSTKKRSACQLHILLNSFTQLSGLPFAALLTEQQLEPLVGQATGNIYTPLVTLWMFLSQVISPDGSCRDAVARFLSWRSQNGQDVCSANTGAYCKARRKLNEDTLKTLVADTGNQLHQTAEPEWLWKGRNVKIVDGTTFTATDTPENQRAYPQPDGQKAGLGFPMLRAVALISLAVGTVLDMAISPYSGQGTGEVSLLRKLWNSLQSDDLLIGDKIYCSYPEIAVLAARNVNFVLPRNASRKTNFRKGKRLGRRDHVVTWTKPRTRPARLSAEEWAEVPETLTLREVEIRLQRRGFRGKTMVVVTTLLDATEHTAEDFGELYAMRWEIEVDLRSIKTALDIGELRCRTPDMVRRELWTSLLAYNLLRGHMANAALHKRIPPREISFKGTMQTLTAFLFPLSQCKAEDFSPMYEVMLTAMASHRVGNRPGRQEPRKVKRRPKHDRLTEPRIKARKKITKFVKI